MCFLHSSAHHIAFSVSTHSLRHGISRYTDKLHSHEPLFDSDPMESNTALAAWTAQELAALCCEVALLADLVKQGAVSFSKPGDFYSAVSANLLRRHSVSRSASALRSKYNKIRDEAIAASQGVDERNLLAQCVAQFAPIYPGQPAPAPLPPHAYSAEEQAAVLKYKAEWGLDMAE